MMLTALVSRNRRWAPGGWSTMVAAPSPSAQRAALPPATSLLVTHGRGGLGTWQWGVLCTGGGGRVGGPIAGLWDGNAPEGHASLSFIFPCRYCTTAAKSSVGVDQISILESLNFMQKGWRSLLREGGTCCCGMSPLLLHRWLIAPHDFLTHKISPPRVCFFLD